MFFEPDHAVGMIGLSFGALPGFHSFGLATKPACGSETQRDHAAIVAAVCAMSSGE
jgi:hypothetical protein